MSLYLCKQKTGAFLSESVVRELKTSLNRWGSAQLIVASSEAVLAVKRQIASLEGLSVGIEVLTFNEWLCNIWKLYGDDRRLVSPLLREVFLQQILKDASEKDRGPLDTGIGTVLLLASLAQDYLTHFAKFDDLSSFSEGQKAAYRILQLYEKVLRKKQYVERCQVLECVIEILSKEGPSLIFSRVEDLPESILHYIRSLSYKRTVLFSLFVPDGPAGDVANNQLVVLGGSDALYCLDEESTQGRESQELDDLLVHVFRAQEDNLVESSGDVAFLYPLGQYAEAASITSYIDERMEAGHKTFALYTSQPDIVWETLSQKLAYKNVKACYQRSVRIQNSLAGRAFINLIDAYIVLARRVELEKSLDYQAPDHEMGDMSWWPPRSLTDYLLSPISGISPEQAWSLDKSWRGNRTLYASRILEVLGKASLSSKVCAETIQSLELGRIGSAAQHIMEYLLKNEVSKDVLDDAQSIQDNSRQESIKVMKKIISSAQELHEAGVSLTLQNLKNFVNLCGMQTIRMPTSNGITSDVSVEIMPVSRACSFESQRFDSVIFQGMDTVHFGVKSSDGALLEFEKKLNGEHTITQFSRYQRDFYTALSTAKRSVGFERILQDGVFDAVALSEVKACYPKDFDKQNARYLGEEQVLINLLPNAKNLKKIAELPIADSGEIPNQFKSIVVLPQCLSRQTLEKELKGLIEVSREGLPLLSASQIETYLECPYKWFTQRRIRVSQIDAEFSPMQMGTFIHRVLELTHSTLLAESLGCSVDEIGEKVKNRLIDNLPGSYITFDSLSHAQEVLDGCFAQVIDEQYKNINRASMNEFIPHTIQEKQQIEDLKLSLKKLLKFEAGHFIGYQPRFFELKFGRNATVVEYAGAQFTGSIDRVDVNAHGQALIIDYKHKASSGLESYSAKLKIDDEVSKDVLPRHVQSVIYAQIMRKQLTEFHLRPVGAIYLGTKEQKGKNVFALAGIATEAATEHIWNIDSVYKKVKEQSVMVAAQNETTFNEYLDSWEELIAKKVQAMLEGDIYANPCDAEACKYCPVTLCNKRRLH